MNMNIQRLSSRYPKQKGRKLFFLKNMPWKQNSKQESGPLNSKSASQPIISVNINSELLCKEFSWHNGFNQSKFYLQIPNVKPQ